MGLTGWVRAAAQVARDLVTPPRMTLDLEPLQTFDTAPRPVDQVISAMKNGDMVKVSRDLALTVAAVQRGRNDLCSIATIPLRLFRGLDVVDSPLFRQFDPDVPNVVHMAKTVEDLAFEGIAWWQVTGQDFDGYPASVRRIDPRNVSLVKPGTSPNSTLAGLEPLNQSTQVPTDSRFVWIDRCDGKGWVQWPASLMIRFDSPNPGILKANARAIRIAIKLDRLTEMYADNPALREYFTDNPASDVDPMEDDEIDRFLAEYGAMRQYRPYGWIPGAVVRSDVSSPSPKDLTLAELKSQVTIDIANGLGVDPEDLGVSTTSRTYQNSVDRKQDKINRVYSPYMDAVTDRLMMGDVTRRGHGPQFDLTEYLKSDPVTQATYWKALMDMGVVDEAEVRGFAGLSGPPPAKASPAPPAAPAIGQNRHLPTLQFDAEQLQTFAWSEFAGADVPAPAVDQTARTITGLAVPYGAIADKYGIKITFDPGSLEYSSPDRMAHLMDHGTPVGFHRSITDTAAGPMVELAVLDGPDGSPQKAQRDGLLYDAAHGLYSGLSVGVSYSLYPEDGDVTVDDDGVYHVVRATWRETSSTYMPAFDDARVTQVAASLTGGTTVDPCQHCGHRHAPNIACQTFIAQLRAQPTPQAPAGPQPTPAPQPDPQPDYVQLLAAFQASLTPAAPAALPAGPTPVSPHHTPAQVTEPLPYRFDRHGNLRAGSHDFSGDIAIGYNPNYQGGESREGAEGRIKAWLEYAFGGVDGQQHLGQLDVPPQAAGQFAITPANVVNLNYPQNHPEMYVDQLDFLYPMYQEFNKGTLDTVTPFVLPKFSASSGLVTDHVTGTEPTPGAFTATAQTITPTPLSGKVEITREVFDQGGNPQASGLIWRQMTRGYYEGIEAAIQAFFVANAASITDIALGVAVTDAAMDQSLAAAISALQYIRGGDRYQKIFTQIDLYQKLIKAVDSTGRPLYPTFGAMNASGIAAPAQNWLNVRGKTFVPAWATAATGTVAASSWMMDPDVVGIWLSTPQRLDLQWRVAWVDLGIFGYKALAITDFTRTRELVYDPV